jgi:phenylacetate-coenzyme A ligase PaaK-like adenylate-forming protein
LEKSIYQLPLQFLARHIFYNQSQYWTREKLKKYQNERLKRLIRYANKHVPYYRDLFKESGFEVDKFRGIKDMDKIPLLDKKTVRTRKEEFLSDEVSSRNIIWDSTSGSTGTPLHFALNNSVQANKIAALLRSFFWAGYRLRQRTLMVQSYYFKEMDFQSDPFYNIIRFDSNRLSRASAVQLAEVLIKKPVKTIIGFPFDILLIARFAAEADRKIPSPDSIITYGEKLSGERRQLLIEYYGCPVFDFHSMHECSAMISQCEKGSYHLIEDFAYMEIVDEKGKPTTDKGMLVGTNYYNYMMPLIRYNTRDAVQPSSTECACGRTFRRVEEIFGKECDAIQTPDGRILGAVMSHSVDRAKGVIMSQCIQDALDHVLIRIVVDKSYDSKSQIALEEGLRKRTGNKMKLDFEIVTQLEKTAGGKTPFIISKISNRNL